MTPTPVSYLGKWKHQGVYTFYSPQTKTWTFYIKHSYFGTLCETGFEKKPKLGMAKKIFGNRLKHLNEQERRAKTG